MSPQSTWRVEFGARRLLSCAVIAGALPCAGCASWQLPRIDPTGESLLIWPDQPPVAVVAPPPGVPVVVAPGVAPPFVAPAPPPVVPLPSGNVQAAPVYSDVPAAPLAPAPAAIGPPIVTVPAVLVAPPGVPVPVIAQSIAVPPPGAVPVGQDYLRITPDRVLAPVGSEVVLKAGICSAAGYLLKDHRVEWLLSRDGPGQFVDVAERDEIDIFRWTWDTPHKHDNWYVVGATVRPAGCSDSRNSGPSR